MRLLGVTTVCLCGLPSGRAFVQIKPSFAAARSVRPSRAVTSMGLDLDLAPYLAHPHVHTALSEPQQLVELYHSLAASHGLAVDAFVTSIIYGASQTIATLISRMAPHIDQLARFVVFGCLDGTAGHLWYHMINDVIAGTSVREVAVKMAADATFYTPTYCLSFLALITLAEGGGMPEIINRLRADYRSMVVGTWMLMAPCNAVIYGVVPLQYQVLASCVVMFCYTVLLALWESRGGSRGFSAHGGASHAPSPSPGVPLGAVQGQQSN